jgi:hypothetical protein
MPLISQRFGVSDMGYRMKHYYECSVHILGQTVGTVHCQIGEYCDIYRYLHPQLIANPIPHTTLH